MAIVGLLAKCLLCGPDFSTPDPEGTFDRQATGAEVGHEPIDQYNDRDRDCASANGPGT